MKTTDTPTKAQAGLLRELLRWGEMSMDADHAAGCHGAALDRVFDSISRRGWIEGNWGSSITVTPAGNDALRRSKAEGK